MMGADTYRAGVSTSSASSVVVLKKLENAILSGHSRPRERLVGRNLLAQFDVSRTEET